MSRYIDADHLRKWILSWWERTEPTSEYLKGGDILNQIDREPSIDIVRCGECKYSEKTSSPITALWCKRFGLKDMAVEANDFCSYGERADRKTEDIVKSFGFKTESYRQAKAKTEQTERSE